MGLSHTEFAIRSSLYVPGDRPDRFAKAAGSGADTIIIDLEDSVAPGAKSEARSAAAEWLAHSSSLPVWVRVNNHPDLLSHDLEMVQDTHAFGVVVPKATAAAIAQIKVRCVALIESARGLRDAHELAESPNVVRLAIGEADLCADLGIDPSPDRRELWPARSSVVIASTCAGLVAPAGPVATDLRDVDGLAASSEQLRRQGFGGRSIIHPDQVEAVHRAFTPAAGALEHARRVIAAFESAESHGTGTAVVDGVFVDHAVVRMARSRLAQSSPLPSGVDQPGQGR